MKRSALIVLLVTFLCPEVWGYSILYNIFDDVAGHPHVSLNSDGFSFSDVYDQFAESHWSVTAAADDGNGGVNVEYSMNNGEWDSYHSGISFSFQIVSDYGGEVPESITVDGWGGVYLSHELNWGQNFDWGASCCGPDWVVHSPVQFDYTYSGESDRDPLTGNLYSLTEVYGAFDGSFSLLTNTTYYFEHFAFLFVESWVRDPPPHFDLWGDYYAFMNYTGGSGYPFTRSQGFFDYNFSISSEETPPLSVPEPSTALLMGALFAVISAKRKFSKSIN